MTSTEAEFQPAEQLQFVTAVSRVDVLGRRLLRSPCIESGRCRLVAHFNASSAAQAFNSTLDAMGTAGGSTWLVWVHQDVFLPGEWDKNFLRALQIARRQIPQLAVAGVYGIARGPVPALRAGHVLDRGTLLREPAALPCEVDSLDELLFAVRAGTQLKLEPALGFDFYATDVVLQAQARGFTAAAVDAYCEHWSDTPKGASIPPELAQRILASGRAFEARWSHRFPLETSWLALHAAGDVERFVDSLQKGSP
jgi:hypothetical protein